MDRLLGEQADTKRQRTIERRIRDAHFGDIKTLEGFDWKFNAPTIDRVQIEELATGDFIRRGDNLLIVGQSGVGKSHLLSAIGRRACTQGYKVRYISSCDLLNDLVASLADGTTPKRLRYYARFDLVIIDGFGFDELERAKTPEALSLFFKLIDKRNSRCSTALITNIDFDTWPEYLGDPPMVMALLDRLVDRAIILKINGKSYRAHRAKLMAAARAKKAASNSNPSTPASSRCAKNSEQG